ncbi:MAG: hypothetical protein CSB13_08290 [Chloroflexi bacterium]|nr:MAG: hypothetical protein CSB13_08290 [Chloroflexota bacterium]
MSRKYTRTVNIAIVIFLMVLLVGCSHNSDTWQKVQDTGTLLVGLDPTYPPFESFDGENLSGFDVDLAYAIGKDLGVEIQFVHFGYDGLYDALLTEQADVLISALVIIPEKTKDFAYSEPYFNAGEVLVVPQGETEISDMESLNGRSLAVELGAQGHVLATEWERKLDNLTILPFNTPDAALTAVLENKAHAAIIDNISSSLFLKTYPELTAIAPPLTVEPFAIVVRAEDNQLLSHLNKSLNNLQNTNNLTEIHDKWFAEN